ncbi:MAG: glycosyltransferase [Thaumarchaeota archaeon]|nr:glycosyltransferase [Nitrososphaerota archaeon]
MGLSDSMVSNPRVSVVMPNFNEAEFLGKAIESVLGQTMADLELIVVDGHSTDNSLKIARSYADEDNRVRVITEEERKGVSASRNIGIREAKGEAIAFLDSDDLYAPEKLEKQWAHLKAQPNPVIVYCDRWKLDIDGMTLPPESLQRRAGSGMIFGDFVTRAFGHIHTILVPAQCLGRVGLFDESLRWAEDYDLLLRLARSYPFEYVDEKLYGYRKHPGNTQNIMDRQSRLRSQAIVLERNLRVGGKLMTPDQKKSVVKELLRLYSETNQRGRLLKLGLTSRPGPRYVLRYFGRRGLKLLEGTRTAG